MLLLQNEINGLDYILRRAKAAGMQIAMNPSPFEETLKALPLDLVDIFLVNEVEGYQMTGCQEPEAILQELERQYGGAAVVLTLGGQGSVYAKGGKRVRQPIYRVPVVDTTAAGDTFTGFFLTCATNGFSIPEALRLASIASSIAVSKKGAAISIPTMEEVKQSKIQPYQP